MVSEWSPVAWGQELSLGESQGQARDTPQWPTLPPGLYVPSTPKPPSKMLSLPGPDTGVGSWEMEDGVGAPCPPETSSWVALDFGGPLKEKKGLREGHEEGVGR